MDSANSSSLQSSSGGDDGEFDSRVDSLSAFFQTSTAGSTPTAALPPSLISSSSPAVDAAQHFFDYSYLDSSTPLLPIDSTPWPPSSHLVSGSASLAAAVYPAAGVHPSSSVQQPTEQPPAAAPPPRSSKKRSRASRRAPTTVLTTDTSNFRAMVQEFTGIPSPPFAAAAAASASTFIRSRLDLFHSAAAFRSSTASVDAGPPSFLLRPFSQKVQSPPSFTSMFTNSTSSPPPHTRAINGGLQSLLQPSLLGQNYTHPNLAGAFSFNAKAAAPAPQQHIPPPSAEYTDNELGGRLLQPVLISSELRTTPGGGSSQLRTGSSCKPNYPVTAGTTELNSTYGEGGGGGGGGSGGEGRGTGGVMDSFFRLRDS